MISKILYSYFSLTRLHALAKKIKELLSAEFPEQPMLLTVLTSMEPKLAVALKSIGSTSKQPLTKAIRRADSERDDSYLSLKKHIKSGLRRRNDVYRSACEALWVLFEKNNLKLYRTADDDESSLIDSLVADLSTPENQAHLATVNATEWLAELDSDNKAFAAISAKRSVTRSADDTVEDIQAFADLKHWLDLLSNVLNSLCLVNNPEGIRETAAQINQYIIEANAAAKQSGNHPDN